MFYFCKKCKNCCKECSKCCDSCANCVDECCSSCCQYCGNCCESIIGFISKIFSKPFSFCAFFAFFITFLPTILMISALIKSTGYKCEEDMTKISFFIQGVNNLLNFLFCIYLVFQHSKRYPGKGKEGSEEKNVLQRTINLIMYDFVVCFYVIAYIFFAVWSGYSHSVYRKELYSSDCFLKDGGYVMNMFMFNLIAMDVYLIGGVIVFIFCLIIAACDEGSCTLYDTCRCLLLCCTCGCWDIGKEERKQNQNYNPNRREFAERNRQNYPENRNNWLQKSKTLLQGIGLIVNPQNNQPPQVVIDNRYSQQQGQFPQSAIQKKAPNVPPQQFQNPYIPQDQFVVQHQYQQQVQQQNPYIQNPSGQFGQPMLIMPSIYQQNVGVPSFVPPPPPPPPPAQGFGPDNQINMNRQMQDAPQNPQHIPFDPSLNQNPYMNPAGFPQQQFEMNQLPKQKEPKTLFQKAKEATEDIKNKLFKKN